MQKGALNRAQPKADFPTFVSIPVERCFETASFKLISLEKGRTRVNFFQTTSIRQLSSVIQYFKSVISQSKKKKKKEQINAIPLRPFVPPSVVHAPTRRIPITFTIPVQYPYYSKCPPFHSLFLLSLFPSASMATSAAMKQPKVKK